MPGEALQPVALAASANVRGAPQAAVQMPAPGMLDGNPAQLREGAFQHRAGGGGNVLGNAAQIGAATAKQQAVIRGQAEIIRYELVVDHAAVSGQQRTCEGGVQGHSRHLVGAHWQQAPRQLPVKLVDVGIAGQDQDVAAHFAVFGAGDKAIGGLAVIEYAGLFVQASTGLFNRRCQALGQFQRVEVGTLWVVQRGLVTRAVDPFRQGFTFDQLQLVVTPFFAGFALGFAQHADAPGQHRGPQAAGTVVDIEAMAFGEFAHLVGGPAHAVPQTACAFRTETLFQRRHVARPAQQRLPAIAP
ncbi:hypothetical protein D3C77_435320 [compost metagenome]